MQNVNEKVSFMKLVQYQLHSIVFEEDGFLFEHNLDNSSNTYTEKVSDSENKLLNKLLTEKVENYFKQEVLTHMAVYDNLYEITTESKHIFMYVPETHALYMRDANNASCVEIGCHSYIYSIIMEKLRQLLNNVTISVHLERYNPLADADDPF